MLVQDGVTSVSPDDLKAAITKHAPQFAGYSQHDAHELLVFLLDGLHEELNRAGSASPRPYIEVRCANPACTHAVQSKLK